MALSLTWRPGWRSRFVLACGLLGALAACSSPPPPKPLTEAEVRSHWTPEQTERALASLSDPIARDALARYFAEQAREARAHGMMLAVESVRVGDNMEIGGGLSMMRVFALYHEYNDERFISYLGGFELIGGRLRTDVRRQVGGSKTALVKLDFAELNRVILTAYTFAQNDPPCCPSAHGQIGFQLGPTGFEPLE